MLCAASLMILFATSACSSKPSAAGDPAAPPVSPQPSGGDRAAPTSPLADAMFTIENTRLSNDPVVVGQYRIEAKQGHELFVVTLQFTERGKALPMDEYKQLTRSPLAKNMADIFGRVVAPGDLQYRLSDGSLLPCSVMPVTEQDPAPPMSITSPDGHAEWMMRLGRLNAVGAVLPGQIPLALIWGGKYEVPINHEGSR
jgi:hypothetical protein